MFGLWAFPNFKRIPSPPDIFYQSWYVFYSGRLIKSEQSGGEVGWAGIPMKGIV